VPEQTQARTPSLLSLRDSDPAVPREPASEPSPRPSAGPSRRVRRPLAVCPSLAGLSTQQRTVAQPPPRAIRAKPQAAWLRLGHPAGLRGSPGHDDDDASAPLRLSGCGPRPSKSVTDSEASARPASTTAPACGPHIPLSGVLLPSGPQAARGSMTRTSPSSTLPERGQCRHLYVRPRRGLGARAFHASAAATRCSASRPP